MALLSVDFFSDVLEVGASMNVVWPQTTEHQVGVSGGRETSGGPPVLYLLHGRTDDHSAWVRNTSIERYAVAAGVAVVMPAVQRSFYTDEVHGDRYWTFLSEELPALVGSMFRVSQRREDTFVAGLSMGGYGAVKWALRDPDRFAAAATMSGALDIRALLRDPERRQELVDRVFGPDPGPDEDVFALLESADAGPAAPAARQLRHRGPPRRPQPALRRGGRGEGRRRHRRPQARRARVGVLGHRDPDGPGLAPAGT